MTHITFDETIDMCNEDSSRLTSKGMSALYDVLSHLSVGGTVYDHPEFTYDACLLFLAVLWLEAEDAVVGRE